MKGNFKYQINYIAVRFAVVNFILSIICLLLLRTSGDSGLVGIGYCYTLLAALLNTIMLLLVVGNGVLHYKDYAEHLGTIFIVLVNIPVTLFYLNLL